MSQPSSVLQNVSVASPCRVSWDKMTGDEKVRFCHKCQLSVHNLSALSTAEAEAFVASAQAKGTRTCIQFYRRADGMILTKDCPVGVRAARRRMTFWASCVALNTFLLTWFSVALTREKSRPTTTESWQDKEPVATLRELLHLRERQPTRTAGVMPMPPGLGESPCPTQSKQ